MFSHFPSSPTPLSPFPLFYYNPRLFPLLSNPSLLPLHYVCFSPRSFPPLLHPGLHLFLVPYPTYVTPISFSPSFLLFPLYVPPTLSLPPPHSSLLCQPTRRIFIRIMNPSKLHGRNISVCGVQKDLNSTLMIQINSH